MSIKKFICTSEEKPTKNHVGEVIGTTPKRALYYSKSVGEHRTYRDYMDSQSKSMKLKTFSGLLDAQQLCNEVNEAYNDNFKVEELA